MVKIEDFCCGCDVPSYPCLGSNCPNKNVEVHFCDKCEGDSEKFFGLDSNEELCFECFLEKYSDVVKNNGEIVCDNCNEYNDILYKIECEDTILCKDCIDEIYRL